MPESPKPVLILIDVQKGFADPIWGPRNNPAFKINVDRLLRAWRATGLPMIHVRHDSRSPNSPLRPGEKGNGFMDVAKPWPDEPIVAKTVNSAFLGTDLECRLRNTGAKTVVFAGLTTDHCVSTSVRMAGNLGFTAWVVSDATATFDRQDEQGDTIPAADVHRVSLASLRTEFATVISTSRVIPLMTAKGVYP